MIIEFIKLRTRETVRLSVWQHNLAISFVFVLLKMSVL